jgi:hypothetical protein
VNAVEITDTVQVVAPPRWSETLTTPSGPAMVLEAIEETCEPSDTLAVGVLIDSVPATSWKVAGVAEPAGSAVAPARAANVLARNRSFRILSWPFFRWREQAGKAAAFV